MLKLCSLENIVNLGKKFLTNRMEEWYHWWLCEFVDLLLLMEKNVNVQQSDGFLDYCHISAE